MTISKAQQKSVRKYVKQNYDLFQVMFPKGQKDVIKAQAEKQKESINQYINKAVNERLKRENAIEISPDKKTD